MCVKLTPLRRFGGSRASPLITGCTSPPSSLTTARLSPRLRSDAPDVPVDAAALCERPPSPSPPFWRVQTRSTAPAATTKEPVGVAAQQFYVARESSSCRNVLAPQRDNGRCWSHLQTPGDADQAQETSRSNQCLLTYTDRLIYDETLKKSFIFHHL